MCGLRAPRLFTKNLFFFSLFSDISYNHTPHMLERRGSRGATLCPCACPQNAAYLLAYALPALYRKPNPVPSNPSITLRPAALHSTVRVTILTCAGAARECASHDGRSAR